MPKSAFKRGQKVLCVDGSAKKRLSDPFDPEDITIPEEGEIYTIRDVIFTKYGVGLRFEEIHNPIFQHAEGGYQEPCFLIGRFEIVE